MSDATQTQAQEQSATSEMASSELLKQQIEQFTNFNRPLVGSGSIKKIMEELQAKSNDLWQVPPEEIVVIPGYNPRVHNAMYFAGIKELAENMAKHGYMQDKPMAVYISKVDGVDRLCLQDGNRRHAAVLYAKAKLGANIKSVPVVVKKKELTQLQLLKEMLHANEYTPFTVYEKAVVAKRMKEQGMSNGEIAEEMHCTEAFVGQMLTLAGAPEAIQQLVDSGSVSATLAHDTIKEHGNEVAVEVLTAAVKSAKAKGKTRATAKDVASPADQKAKNAKKIGYELYRSLKKLRDDPVIEKKIDAKLIEVIDELILKVETLRKPKEAKAPKAPKPIKVKPSPAAKKTPVAKKIATVAATKRTTKRAPWAQAA